jgi:hypothetical protein
MPALIVAVLMLVAQSQPPAPRDGPSSQSPQQKPQSQTEPTANQRTNTNPPTTVAINNVQPAQDTQQQPNTNSRSQNQAATPYWSIVVSAVSLGVSTVLTLIIAGATVGLFIVAVLQAITLAEQQQTMQQALIDTRRAAQAAIASADGLKNSERAYIGIQYRQKADEWTDIAFSFHRCTDTKTLKRLPDNCHRLHIRVVNSGRTPARILNGGGIKYIIDLPRRGFDPKTATFTEDSGIAPNFLHAGGRYSEKLTYEMAEADVLAKDRGELWLVGFLLYEDVFGRRHRAGFCRHVSGKPDSGIDDNTKNNLSVDDSCGGYNYDYEVDDQGNRKNQPTEQS